MKLVRSLFIPALLFVAACAEGGFGSDWTYTTRNDKISGEPFSFAIMLLPASDYTNQPDAIIASCDSNKFELFISSEGYWGSGSRYFRANQTFELRIDDKVYSGKYLPDVEGDNAWLISATPKFSAVNRQEILASLASATYVAARVSDYRGASSTTSSKLSGNSEGLLRVMTDCGITLT